MAPVDPWIGPRGSARGRLLEILRDRGPMTRPEAARLTGMSVGGIRPLVAGLVAEGHLVEQPTGARPGRGRGRPGMVLVPVLPDGTVLGIDFGHAHAAVAVADLSGAVLAERRAAVDVDHDAPTALELAGRLAAECLSDAGRSGHELLRVGVGVPGPVDRAGHVRSSTIVASWWQRPVAGEVADLLGTAPERIDVRNDAHLGALGEHRCGAGVGRDDLVYVKASHGLGAGLVFGGELYRGAQGITGELGHAVVDPDGALCRCGARGCLETVVSVGAVAGRVRFVTGDPARSLPDAHEHPAARRVVVDAGRALGQALADVCNLLDPSLVVLGGELAVVGEPLVAGVTESLRRFAQPAVSELPVVLGELGARAELVGAVVLAAEQARRAAWRVG